MWVGTAAFGLWARSVSSLDAVHSACTDAVGSWLARVTSGSERHPPDAEVRVCPAAGRYDLHHAIVYNGGYRVVAEELDRRPVRGAMLCMLHALLGRHMEQAWSKRLPSCMHSRCMRRWQPAPLHA